MSDLLIQELADFNVVNLRSGEHGVVLGCNGLPAWIAQTALCGAGEEWPFGKVGGNSHSRKGWMISIFWVLINLQVRKMLWLECVEYLCIDSKFLFFTDVKGPQLTEERRAERGCESLSPGRTNNWSTSAFSDMCLMVVGLRFKMVPHCTRSGVQV